MVFTGIGIILLLTVTRLIAQAKDQPIALPTGELEATFAKAQQAFNRGDFKQAEQLLIEILGHHAAHTGSLYLLGSIHFLKNERDTALGILQRARDSAPDQGRIHFRLYEVLQSLGQKDEALQSLEEAVRTDPYSREWRDSMAS